MATTSSRMLTLLSLLQTPRTWPGEVLAERLGVTTRTVRRDVERLRELGYRIGADRGPGAGYRLEAGSELPPLLFDDDQALALAVALGGTAGSGIRIEEAAQRALATVRQVMPSRLRHRLDSLRFSVAARESGVEPAVLRSVGEAVHRRMTLRFDYPSAAPADGAALPATSPRRTAPHGLVARHGRWYLVAWDDDREDWRLFRLDRMVPRIPLGPAFTPRPIPTGDAATFVSARAKGAIEEDVWPCTGRFEVELPAHQVAPWLRDGHLEVLSPTRCRVTAGSWSWAGLLSDVLRLDAPFRLLDPPQLLAAAEPLARRLEESVGSTGHGGDGPGDV